MEVIFYEFCPIILNGGIHKDQWCGKYFLAGPGGGGGLKWQLSVSFILEKHRVPQIGAPTAPSRFPRIWQITACMRSLLAKWITLRLVNATATSCQHSAPVSLLSRPRFLELRGFKYPPSQQVRGAQSPLAPPPCPAPLTRTEAPLSRAFSLLRWSRPLYPPIAQWVFYGIIYTWVAVECT